MGDQLELTTQEEATEVKEAGRPAERLPLPEVRTVEAKRPDSQPVNFKKSLPREYFESAVVTLIMALFGMTFIVQAVKVPTGSMKNTIWIQDHLLVNKFIFGPNHLNIPLLPQREIRRGDIVVFKFPRTPETNFVKRVIGLPGETVEYDSRTNTGYVNGEELAEKRVFVEPQYNNDDATPLKEVQSDTDVSGAQWKVYYYQNDRESVALNVNDERAK